MYDLEIDCVKKRYEELIKLYPDHQERIKSSITDAKKFPDFKPSKLKQMLNADKLLDQYATKATNMTFEQQQEMKITIVEPADGEQSDYESDYEELSSLEDAEKPSRQEIKLENRQKRIFKYLNVVDKTVTIPDQKPAVKDADPLTLFIEIDDVFLHTFLVDENFGHMAKCAH